MQRICEVVKQNNNSPFPLFHYQKFKWSIPDFLCCLCFRSGMRYSHNIDYKSTVYGENLSRSVVVNWFCFFYIEKNEVVTPHTNKIVYNTEVNKNCAYTWKARRIYYLCLILQQLCCPFLLGMCLVSQFDQAMTYSICNEAYLTPWHSKYKPKIESSCSGFACCAARGFLPHNIWNLCRLHMQHRLGLYCLEQSGKVT